MKRIKATILSFYYYVRAFTLDWDKPKPVPLTREQALRRLKSRYVWLAVDLYKEGKLSLSEVLKLDMGFEPSPQAMKVFADPDAAPKIPQKHPKGTIPTFTSVGSLHPPLAVKNSYWDAVKRPRGLSKAIDQQKAGGYVSRPGGIDEESLIKHDYEHAQKILEHAKMRYIGWHLVQFFAKLHK